MSKQPTVSLAVDGVWRYVKGVTKYTTCDDIIHSLLDQYIITEGVAEEFDLFHITSDTERRLDRRCRILKETLVHRNIEKVLLELRHPKAPPRKFQICTSKRIKATTSGSIVREKLQKAEKLSEMVNSQKLRLLQTNKNVCFNENAKHHHPASDVLVEWDCGVSVDSMDHLMANSDQETMASFLNFCSKITSEEILRLLATENREKSTVPEKPSSSLPRENINDVESDDRCDDKTGEKKRPQPVRYVVKKLLSATASFSRRKQKKYTLPRMTEKNTVQYTDEKPVKGHTRTRHSSYDTCNRMMNKDRRTPVPPLHSTPILKKFAPRTEDESFGKSELMSRFLQDNHSAMKPTRSCSELPGLIGQFETDFDDEIRERNCSGEQDCSTSSFEEHIWQRDSFNNAILCDDEKMVAKYRSYSCDELRENFLREPSWPNTSSRRFMRTAGLQTVDSDEGFGSLGSDAINYSTGFLV